MDTLKDVVEDIVMTRTVSLPSRTLTVDGQLVVGGLNTTSDCVLLVSMGYLVLVTKGLVVFMLVIFK